MNKLKITLGLLMIAFTLPAFTSCKALKASESTPVCIQDKIRQIQKEKPRNPPAEIWQYDYNGQLVYYIQAYCCDIPSQLYDKDCNLMGKPDGGFTGRGDGRCIDFNDKKTNGKLIWEDKRK